MEKGKRAEVGGGQVTPVLRLPSLAAFPCHPWAWHWVSTKPRYVYDRLVRTIFCLTSLPNCIGLSQIWDS